MKTFYSFRADLAHGKPSKSLLTMQQLAFHVSASCQNEEELFAVAGKSMTISQIREIAPIDRTIAHWAILVDWDLQRQRPYVIVDPYDPEGLLYLSRAEYLSTVKVCASNDMSVMVVARPGSTRPSPISQNSPHHSRKGGAPFDSYEFFNVRLLRLTWRDFMKMRNFVSRNVKVEDGMVSESSKTITKTLLLWARQLLHYSSVTSPERRLQGINPFAQALALWSQHNGTTFAAKRLKIMLFAIYSYISGHPLKSTEGLGLRIRLSNGLPTAIPRDFRDLIRERNLKWIRVWVSILNIYRSLGVKTPDPQTAYDTICKPHPDLKEVPLFTKWRYFCKEVWPRLVADQAPDGKIPSYKYQRNFGLIVRSAGANLRGSASILSLILDAKAWLGESHDLPLEWFKLHRDTGMVTWYTNIQKEHHWCSLDLAPAWEKVSPGGYIPDMETLLERPWEMYALDSKTSKEEKERILKEKALQKKQIFDRAKVDGAFVGFANDAIKPSRETLAYRAEALKADWENRSHEENVEFINRYEPTAYITGRLHNFDAPGGKLRTVAICDYWTQVAMKSVHDHLFKILKLFGHNDATFDQDGTVNRYFQQGFKPHWSYDLSAATDSIPLSLYIECLTPLMRQQGETYDNARERVLLWSKLMTDRDFHIPSPKKGELYFTGEAQSRTVRYSTGQPMGAYSSWASMAVVHHALVQFSSWLANNEPSPILRVTEEGRPTTMPSWFNTYLVLGDDVDIATCGATALEYKRVCDAFSIKIGLAKSLHSRENVFEFANQRFCEDGNISPLSFSEELSSSQSWNRRVEFVRRIADRFGIVLNETNLVRLTLTSRQWTSLIPEMSGFRPKALLRLLQFILLNPLKPTWHSAGQFSIDAVLKWLSLLKEMITATASAEVWGYLEMALCDKIAEKLKAEVKAKVASIPPSRSMFAHEQPICLAFEAVGHKRMGNYEFFVPQGSKYNSITRGKNAKYAISYIQASVNIFNERLHRDLRQFEINNWKYLTPPRLVVDPIPTRNIPGEVWSPKHEEPSSAAMVPLETWVKLWLELGNFPQPITMDSERFAPCLRTEPDGKVLAEHAEALLMVILPLVAEYLGHSLAGVPYYPLRGAQGGSWYRTLKRSLKLFRITQSEVDANPGLNAGLLNYIRSKMYRVSPVTSSGRAQITAATLVAQSDV